MELKGGRAVEQLVSLSLHVVSRSFHRVSLQGPVVALGELDRLHDNWRLQGKSASADKVEATCIF